MLRSLLLLASVHSSWELRAAPCPVPLRWPAPPARSVVPPVCKVPRAFRVPPAELVPGSERDGLVSKITDYGCFVKLANENRMGLVHISTLAPERLEKEEVPEFIESQIGPVGSKVRVKVMSVGYRGQKRISLQLQGPLFATIWSDLGLHFLGGPHRPYYRPSLLSPLEWLLVTPWC